MSSSAKVLLSAFSLIFLSHYAEAARGVNIATTPHFPAFNYQNKSVSFKAKSSKLFLEATTPLHVRTCTVFIQGSAAKNFSSRQPSDRKSLYS